MCWNEPLIRELVAPEDVTKITALSPSRLRRKDGYVWKHTKSGAYTVRSGYELVNKKRREIQAQPVEEPSTTTTAEAQSWKVAQITPVIAMEIDGDENSEEREEEPTREIGAIRCQVDASWTHKDKTTGLGFIADCLAKAARARCDTFSHVSDDTPVWFSIASIAE
ncbi:hypothetical protein Rs2_04057 [Raphanus sativus]|nr:hypothetical protein Rs2_04057 [Raphanus sativus]